MRFIPYIGSKRKLANYVLQSIGNENKVLDLFSGSGVISYHLKSNGVIVHANDMAPYSYHINKTYLELNDDPILESIFKSINALRLPDTEYFAKYYSQNTEAIKERFYYTRENGLFIDAVLEKIWAGEFVPIRSIVLCDLLYQMTTHANTSGIFKSFHKKIAGGERHIGVRGRVYKSNKKKISSLIQLEKPIFPNGPKGKAFQFEAEDFFNKVDDFYDAIYLDPPYNLHQYSGNYHLLEQACRPLEERYIPTEDQTSGIEPTLYKSPYCSKKRFYKTFCSLFDKIKGRTKNVIVSYNSKGYMSQERMEELMKEKFGNVSVTVLDYINYSGGFKQSTVPVKELIFKSCM